MSMINGKTLQQDRFMTEGVALGVFKFAGCIPSGAIIFSIVTKSGEEHSLQEL